MARITEWRKIPVSLTELCIATTLRCGQSFRWRKNDNDEYSCTLHGRIISLKQDAKNLHYRSIFPAVALATPPTPPSSIPPSENGAVEEDQDDTEELLKHYLNLGPNLGNLYAEWSASDANFKKKAPKFTGVRILKQDAWEALIGFICSSNNNISRITQMVEKLCLHYGPFVAHLDGYAYHDFPIPAALTGKGVESHLRELGFGYRAKYIYQTALIVANDREPGWLDSLRNPESPVFGMKAMPAGKMQPEGREGYRKAHDGLLNLQGCGPKVADCVCLMGLGWGEAVPVDTHVWQIAQRDYKFGRGKHSSLTKATYAAVANHFRKLWGKEAGWAHSVLFTADLRAFSDRLTTKVEVKEEKVVIKKEEGLSMPTVTPIKKIMTAKTTLKRDPDDKILGLNEVNVTLSERVKRRRRG